MKMRRSLKISLMAASVLAASGAAVAHAAPIPAAPTEIVQVEHAGDDDARGRTPAIPVKKVGLAAMAASAVVAFLNLFGTSRIFGFFAKAGPVAAKTARAVVKAPVAAAKAVGRAASTPLRLVMIYAGLGVFALTGVWIYDVEWLGGLAAGMALVGLAWFSTGRMRRAFARSVKPATRRQNRVSQDQ